MGIGRKKMQKRTGQSEQCLAIKIYNLYGERTAAAKKMVLCFAVCS